MWLKGKDHEHLNGATERLISGSRIVSNRMQIDTATKVPIQQDFKDGSKPSQISKTQYKDGLKVPRQKQLVDTVSDMGRKKAVEGKLLRFIKSGEGTQERFRS